MGLLDDAIREHLDLKRRRGADPAEVARLEHEALGPVRREPAAAEADRAAPAPDSAPPADREPGHAHRDDPRREHPADAAHVLPPEERHDPPHGDQLLDRDEDRAALGGAAATPEPADAPAPEAHHAVEPHEPEHDPRHSDIVDQPTTEYRVEDHHGGERHDASHEAHDDASHEPRSDDDVLEETPDFLQETPEHDRLWFEQRPPRDFDFDG
ncbi:MAG TPA: hypothetical protein VFU94_11060 [Conexibacter sp.]|nr:hypothetical protein [Conexibacter sp.]